MRNDMRLIYNKIDTGSRIRYLREQREISCKEMEEKLDGVEEDYGKIEQGKCSMSVSTVLQLASIFQVTVDYLIYGTDEPVSAELPDSREYEEIISLLKDSKPEQREMALKLMQTYLLD